MPVLPPLQRAFSATNSSRAAADASPARLRACWVLVAVWLAAFLMNAWRADPAAGAVQGLALLLFVALHGSLSHGWRGIGAYFAIALTVAFALEASSIATGFPFGFYVHNVGGPKPLGVPLHVVVAYAVLGWLAWCMARLMTRDEPSETGMLARLATPIVASFVLAGFDYAYDAIGATVLGLWTYRHPSGQFGVPLSNFLGWLFTGWLFFQLFALVEDRFRPTAAVRRPSYWLAPCLVWLGSALQYPILLAAAPTGVIARAGRSFVVADVYEASLIASLFTLVFTGLVALVRVGVLAGRPPRPL